MFSWHWKLAKATKKINHRWNGSHLLVEYCFKMSLTNPYICIVLYFLGIWLLFRFFFLFWISKISIPLRGCLYGGELVQLGRLACPGEISPSLTNSYKNIMCLYEKWACLLMWDLTWFCRDPTWVRWKSSTWTHGSGSARQGGIEVSFISFVLLFRC